MYRMCTECVLNVLIYSASSKTAANAWPHSSAPSMPTTSTLELPSTARPTSAHTRTHRTHIPPPATEGSGTCQETCQAEPHRRTPPTALGITQSKALLVRCRQRKRPPRMLTNLTPMNSIPTNSMPAWSRRCVPGTFFPLKSTSHRRFE